MVSLVVVKGSNMLTLEFQQKSDNSSLWFVH